MKNMDKKHGQSAKIIIKNDSFKKAAKLLIKRFNAINIAFDDVFSLKRRKETYNTDVKKIKRFIRCLK